MIVTKENGTVYTNGLTIEVLNWHKEVGYTIADVKRPLTKNEDGEYVDDIAAEEIEAGYEAVRGFLYREITDPLFFKVQRREIEESVWLGEIQKIKDENKMEVANGKMRFGKQSSSKAIPEEVLAKRAEARELINILEAKLGV